ncbi:MAG: GDSL-type esterase/lipase family protein [Acidimicrobiales bacterium]
MAFRAADSTALPRLPKPVSTTTHLAPVTTTTTPTPVWRVAWGSAMAWGFGIASNATIRDLATVGVGGSQIRIRISNQYGNQPLVIGAATVGIEAQGAAIVPGTLHQVTFSGATGTTIPVGGYLYSDPVPLAVSSLQTLAVSVYVSNPDQVTVHPCCVGSVSSYFSSNGAGNLTAGVTSSGFVAASPWKRLVDAVDVLQTSGLGSIVVIGDSITDGYNTTLQWVEVLQRRIDMLPPSEQRAVINEGITANTLTGVVPNDDSKGGGQPGLARLQRDALSQSGVSEVILFLGTNDLWFGATAQEVIAGLQQAVNMVHQAGLRIVGVTLLPRETSPSELWTPTQQTYLEQVNNWILTSGAFDAVLDFATAVADVYNGNCYPTSMFYPYDSGDHLHPNPAGQTAMANSIDTTVLGLPPAPTVPPLVPVTPTPGCQGVLGIPSVTTTTTTTTSPPPSTTSAQRRPRH